MATNFPRGRIALAILGLLTLLLLALPLGRSFPPPSGPDSLALVQQLYTACNTRDPQRLHQVERRLDELHRQQLITPAEHQACQRIIDMAKNGQWDHAAQRSLRFAQHQVR